MTKKLGKGMGGQGNEYQDPSSLIHSGCSGFDIPAAVFPCPQIPLPFP